MVNKKCCLKYLLQALLWIAVTGFFVPAGGEEPPVVAPAPQYDEFNRSVEKALVSEKAAMEELKAELLRTRKMQPLVENELNSYRIQHTTHGSLLLLPGTAVDSLEKALQGTRDSLVVTDKRIKEVAERLKYHKALQAQAAENFKLNEKYLATLSAEAPEALDAKTLSGNIQFILGTFTEKTKVLIELISLVENEKRDLEEINSALGALRERLELQIKNRRKQERFLRTGSFFTHARTQDFRQELSILWERLKKARTPEFWISETGSVFRGTGNLFPAFCLALFLVVLVVLRFRRFCRNMETHPLFSGYPMRRLALHILARSLPLLGITLFLHAGALAGSLSTLPMVRMVLTLLWTFLLTRWGKDLFLPPESHAPSGPIPCRKLAAWSLFAGIRSFSLLYAPLVWLLGGDGLSLMILRLLFAAGLIIWALLFVGRAVGPFFDSVTARLPKLVFLRPLVARMLYTVVIVGPLAETAGYGAFVMYWYMSWGRTLVVCMWAGLLFTVLREWREGEGGAAAVEGPDGSGGDRSSRWLLVQAGWGAWLGAFMLALLLSWSASHELLAGSLGVLKHKFTLGNMSFSIMGGFYALFTLFITHLACRAWRHILKERFLHGSGLEDGLQESILSITGYLIWGMGIFIALHVFGLNTASLAVALGALGIGIGLGLQNIVNNFVSGIILLFERPIQVGDDVEIAGTWATVKKIKVRSTVVQTYDNASLIIPNSEFISNQVTNWSFRDKSLRRKIVVGVAYGSDIQLVRKTLLEIADRTIGVHKYPYPDVVFSDFGDSALIFTLRIWTTIENMLIAETDVRFEIDRLFRERKISIAFPQRDVHLYRMDELPGPGTR